MTLSFVIQTVIILGFCVVCSWQDLKGLKVSNWLLWSASVVQLVFLLVFKRDVLAVRVACGAGYALVLLIVRAVTKKGLGLADVYYGAFVGLCLMPQPLGLSVILSCITGIICGLIWFRHKRIPFIPFMSLGLVTAFLLSL